MPEAGPSYARHYQYYVRPPLFYYYSSDNEREMSPVRAEASSST